MGNIEVRRIGLVGFGLAVLIILLTGCRSPSSPIPGEEMTFTSSSEQSHTHVVTLFRSDIESPPASGISMETSISAGHFHQMTMTQQELIAVNNGTTVSIVTTVDSGHSHAFQIMKWF